MVCENYSIAPIIKERNMQKITPHLWFDTQAKEAADFYVSIFEDSSIKNITSIKNTPSGTADIVTISLAGQEFTLLNAGPYFTINPSVSFAVTCKTKEEVTALWEKLSVDGKVFMELNTYPFNAWYGWIQDRYNVSWQIMVSEQVTQQTITPTMLFAGNACGKAEEAINFYTSIFHDSKTNIMVPYESNEEPNKEGTVKYASFTLEKKEFAAMDSALAIDAPFSEAISFVVHCETQDEIDYYWDKLSAVPEAEQCGWLKDKFGFSWQIVPVAMEQMLETADEAGKDRVTQAFLKMKKFDIATLVKAYEQN